MKKQNSKKDSDLPLNHYITVNFRCYLNLVFDTTGPVAKEKKFPHIFLSFN